MPAHLTTMTSGDCQRAVLDGVELAYLTAGEGPLAVCLHGFPDSAYTWRHLSRALVEVGYTVVAPFLRGFAPSGIAANDRYSIGALVADANALHDALGGDSTAVVVGHDWGGLAAYGAVTHSPHRWAGAVVLGAPPFGTAEDSLRPDRLKASYYMFVLQSPLGEAALAHRRLELVDALWGEWAPSYDWSDDADRAKECLRRPRNLRAAVRFHRSAFDRHSDDPYAAEHAATEQRPRRPVLYVHGLDDTRLPAALVASSARAGYELVETCLTKGGHFLHLEHPQTVNEIVVSWIQDRRPPTASVGREARTT